MAEMAPERGRQMRLVRPIRCTELESGGHVIDAIPTNSVLPAISHEFLTRRMQRRPMDRMCVAGKHGDFEYRFESGRRNSMGRRNPPREVRS